MKFSLTLAALGAAVLTSQSAGAATYTLITPYAGAGTQTSVLGVNDAGFMTGNVTNPDSSGDAFLRSPTGAYTLFSDGDFATLGRAINASNQITGYSYTDNSLTLQTANEFSRSPGGGITLLTNPTTGVALHGIAQGVNSAGVIVGENFTSAGGHPYRHGYILDGASYTDLSVDPSYRIKTVARGVNDAGLVVGWTLNANTGVTQGYVYSGGAFQQFVNDPSATNAGTTYLEDVNNHGLASGEWADAAGTTHPFLYDISTHAFTELAPPGGAAGFDAFGLNNLGEVVLAGSNGVNYLYNPLGVPEPAAWALMLIGVGGIGAAMRASRRRTDPLTV